MKRRKNNFHLGDARVEQEKSPAKPGKRTRRAATTPGPANPFLAFPTNPGPFSSLEAAAEPVENSALAILPTPDSQDRHILGDSAPADPEGNSPFSAEAASPAPLLSTGSIPETSIEGSLPSPTTSSEANTFSTSGLDTPPSSTPADSIAESSATGSPACPFLYGL
ncbi:hypothetical protein MTO96_041326 [Rhipicephalus appendiculatus]